MWGRTDKTGANTYTSFSGVDVFRLDPAGVWTNVTGHWPQHHTVDSPIFTGGAVLVAPGQVWCGACSHPAPIGDYEHSYVVDPQTLQITPLPHGPLDNIGPQVLWTGHAEIALNPAGVIGGPDGVRPGDIAIYDPRTRTWHRGPRAPRTARRLTRGVERPAAVRARGQRPPPGLRPLNRHWIRHAPAPTDVTTDHQPLIPGRRGSRTVQECSLHAPAVVCRARPGAGTLLLGEGLEPEAEPCLCVAPVWAPCPRTSRGRSREEFSMMQQSMVLVDAAGGGDRRVNAELSRRAGAS